MPMNLPPRKNSEKSRAKAERWLEAFPDFLLKMLWPLLALQDICSRRDSLFRKRLRHEMSFFLLLSFVCMGILVQAGPASWFPILTPLLLYIWGGVEYRRICNQHKPPPLKVVSDK